MAINPFKVTGFESKERLRSSEIKEDCLCFVLRGNEELYLNIIRRVNVAINPFKVTGFESKGRLRSSEIKEDCLCFVLRENEELYLNIVRRVNVATNPFKVAGFESKERLRSSEIKEDESQHDDQPLQSRVFFESKQRLLAWKLKKIAYGPFSGEMKAIYDVN